MSELKPCPFCGATPHRQMTKAVKVFVKDEPDGTGHYESEQHEVARCPHLCATLPIEAWNTRSPVESPNQSGAVGVEKGHWWCPSCKEAVIPQRVTFQENHDTCGHPVEWVEFTTTDTRVTPATQDYLQSRTTTQSAPSVGSVPTVEEIISTLKDFGDAWEEENDVADYTFEQFQEAQSKAVIAFLTSRTEGK